MKSFKELGVKSERNPFTGNKISIDEVLNKPIVVLDYSIEKSKFEKWSGMCLYLQIEFEEKKRILFSGSDYLMEVIRKIDKSEFPFTTTIVKDNRRLLFT